MQTPPDASPATPTPAGLPRRLAAAVYDALLVAALCVIPASVVIAVRGGGPVPPGDPLLQVLLIITVGAFFIGFWTWGGQTPGMRTWRLRVERDSGQALRPGRTLLRFAAAVPSIALFGAGIWWALIDSQRRTWPDLLARTRVVVLPSKPSARAQQ